MTTVAIPADVLLHIIEFVDHPKDLLSLALTARALHAIIIPRHIDYRRISCAVSSEHVWKHLLDTPYDACSRIRYLNVLNFHGRTQIPRSGIPEEPKSDSRPSPSSSDSGDYCPNGVSDTFIHALSEMVNLKVLKFQTRNQSGEFFCLISEAIGKANCSLEELEVHFGLSNMAIEYQFMKDRVLKDSKMSSLFCDYLPSLRKYTINGRWCYSVLCLQMLVNTPNLTHMNISMRFSHEFLSGYWPNLQHLGFYTYMRYPAREDYPLCLQKFLCRHSKLVTLSTSDILHPGWTIESDDFLPNLKSLYIHLQLRPCTITTNIAARLVHLRMKDGLYRYLTEHGIILSNLKTCLFWLVNPKESTQRLIDMAPNIKYLCITFGPIYYVRNPRPLTANEIMERVPFFAGFKNLRVFIGPFDDMSVDNHFPFVTLYDFPKLLYTRVGFKDGGIKSFRLYQDEIAKAMRHEEVICDECDFHSWDDLYTM